MIHGLVSLWSLTVAGLAARRQRSHFQSTSARERLLSSTLGHTQEDGRSTPHRSAGGSSNPLKKLPLEALVGELVARRRHLIGKNLRGELTFKDVVNHDLFIQERAEDTFKLREGLHRRQKLINANMKRANKGKDISKMSALTAQGEKVANEVALLDNNSHALIAEQDWLHATEGFNELSRRLRENFVRSASGEFSVKSQLEDDNALFADDGKTSLDTLLQSRKDEYASAARAPEDMTKQVSDGENTLNLAALASDSLKDTQIKTTLVRLLSQGVSLFASKLPTVAAPSPKRLQSNGVASTQRAHSPAPMPPPVPPAQSGYALSPAGKPVVVEIFYDLLCPFSSKMFKTVQGGVLQIFGDRVSFVMHQVIQPWHPQGTWVHEVALAVAAVCPASYPQYVRKVFEAYDAGAFQDDVTWDKTRPQVHEDLLKLAKGLDGINVAKVRAMLQMKSGGGNAGNQVTQRIKWACKFHRTRGVHVTPTVFVNGLEAGVVSSGWTAEEWEKFLAPLGEDFFTGSQL